ncbi:MAG: M56 family metallopeptidase [Oscillospiraceae bacterium]|jgi:beta-lactamase regulating signal transducer with metallopeptidase domain|nr:M56 family metallopeptidase [Oscillospiraceae bacterium]
MTVYTLSFLLKSFVMSVIILVFSAFSALFLKRFRASLRYAVWVVFLIGLLIPMSQVFDGGFITVPLSVEPQAQHTVFEALPNKPPLPNELPIPNEPPLPNKLPLQPDSVRESTTTYTTKDTFYDWVISPFMVCILVWGIVAIAILSYHIRRYFRFTSMIRRWGEPITDETTLSVFRSIQDEKGLCNKKIELRICEFTSSSLLTGFLYPIVVLPKKHFEADELELIFRHELVHFKRHDLFIKLLSVITVSIYWFNPVVYWMYALMQADGEASCDETVLRDVGEQNKQFYAELMVKMIGGKSTASTMLSTCFYGGKRGAKRRLDAILDTTRKMKKPAYAVFIVFVALTVFSGSVFALTTAYEPPVATVDANIYDTAGIIEADEAKAIAIETAGGGVVTECRLENRPLEKFLVYHVHVAVGQWEHCVEIIAETGSIHKHEPRYKP